MEKYNKQWTHFEVQSLVYGILRKNLYPSYLVRGNYKFDKVQTDLAIFKAHKDREPELVLVIKVEHTNGGTNELLGSNWSKVLKVPYCYVRSGTEAYNCLDIVLPLLK